MKSNVFKHNNLSPLIPPEGFETGWQSLFLPVVHPRETFRRAILQGDASVIVAHNHPSGDPDPSDEDMKVTKLLLDARKLIGITVLDHIVFSKDKYYSFRDCEQGNIIDETYKKGDDNV